MAYLKEDISLTPQAICRRLEKEGLEATTAAVKNCLARVDLLKLQPAIREQLNTEGIHPHLLERIFELIEEILSYTTVPECLPVEIKDIKKHFRRPPSGESKSRRWDQEIVRVYNKERRAEKERVLKNKLENKKTTLACPECRGTSVQIKEYRERSYEDLYGERKEEAVRYICNRCHRSFTINPEEVEHYQRTASCLHIHALGQLFKNVSLARVDLDILPGHTSVCKTTILRWMKGTADRMPRWFKVMGSRTTGVVSLDEKWVKLRSKWYYVFIAVDTSTLDILHIDIFPERKKDSARTFFLKLRTMGFKFRTIITDGCPIYDKPLAEIYPQAEHINCILHMGRSRRNRLMEVFGSYSDKRYKRLAPLISDIYAARTEKAFEKAWDKWSRAYKEYPELEKFARDFRREKEELKKSLLRGSIPRTTNSVERVIKEFERKYSNMENYMSLPYAQAWCKLFQVFFRLRPFLEGKRAGKSPAELMGYPVSNLSWKEFLKPEGEYIRDDAAA